MKLPVGESSSWPTPHASRLIRFGNFEVDARAGELRRGGTRVKLSGQPFDVLVALLEQAGQIVTREELHEKLWAEDTFVDFEQGLNKAINKVREALGDEADNPRFIETLPRRGYRFLAPVLAPVSRDPAFFQPPAENKETRQVQLTEKAKPRHWPVIWISAGAIAILMVAGLIIAAIPPRPPRVVRYTQLTRDGLNKFDPPVTDGSRVYFGEVDAQKRSIIAQVSVNGGQVTALVTFPGPPVQVEGYSPARSELLIGYALAPNSPVWALTLPGGSPLRRVADAVTNGASWSDDGQSLLYYSLNEIDVVKPDGSDRHKLAATPGFPCCAHISPDGKVWRFTVNSPDLDTDSLWEVAADGSNLHPMFPDWRDRTDYNGWWTPDGKYFVFGSTLAANWGGGIFALREKRRWFERRAPQPVELTTGPLTFSPQP